MAGSFLLAAPAVAGDAAKGLLEHRHAAAHLRVPHVIEVMEENVADGRHGDEHADELVEVDLLPEG